MEVQLYLFQHTLAFAQRILRLGTVGFSKLKRTEIVTVYINYSKCRSSFQQIFIHQSPHARQTTRPRGVQWRKI